MLRGEVPPDTLLGDTVNVSSRMESISLPGRVTLSSSVEEELRLQALLLSLLLPPPPPGKQLHAIGPMLTTTRCCGA